MFFVHTTIPNLPGGRIGVDLFFTLSGYLITTLLLREHAKTGEISIWRFYMRRVLRLYPALLSVVAFVLIYVWFNQPDQFAITLTNAREVMLYYFNWRMVTDIAHHQWMFSHLWSLSVEEQFYIVWPVLTVWLLRQPRLYGFAIIGAVILLDGIARPLMAPRYENPLWIYFDTTLRADGLMWGALAAWLIHFGYVQRFAALLKWGSVVGLVGLFWLSSKELLMNGWLYYGGFTLVSILSALLIAGAVLGTPLRPILEFGPLRYVGSISYAAYLWHWPVIRITEHYSLHPAMLSLLQIALTFGGAAVSMVLLEAPFLRMKHRFEPVHAVPA